MVINSEGKCVCDPPNFWTASYPYPESWEGWTWGDHPSIVARSIMKAFVRKGHTPHKLTLSSTPLSMDCIVRTEKVDPKGVFDFMNGLHHIACTAVAAIHHDSVVPNKEPDEICKTLISLLE